MPDALASEAPAVSPMFVQHSRPDGTFSPRDDAALAALRAACPQSPFHDPSYPFDDLIRGAICARLHGTSAAAVRAQLLPLCPGLCADTAGCEVDAGDVCPKWLTEVLDVPPFVRLR